MTCILCHKDVSPKGFSTHLKAKHSLTTKEYYDMYLKKPDEGICKVCGKPTSYKNITIGYVDHCSNKCAQSDPDIKEKKKQTCLLKYGVDNAYKSETIKQKIKNTMLERYGVDSVLKLDSVRAKTYEAIASEEVKSNILSTKLDRIRQFEIENDCTLKQTLRKQYGQGWLDLELEELTLNGHAHFIRNSDIPKIIDCIENAGSSFECDVRNYIKSIYTGKLICNSRSIIKPLELDMFIPELNLAIECNGIFWHSSLNGISKDYHYNKSIRCNELGIRLIHIYENEWSEQQSKIKQLLKIALKQSTQLQADCCEVRVIDDNTAKLFNNANHLQNHEKAQATYGLFHDNELIQLMSFSKIKNDSWKIIRLCSSCVVSKGFSKLFNCFVKDYKPSKVFGYCNFSKFDGIDYEELGLHCTKCTGPEKLLLVDNQLISKDSCKYTACKSIARGFVWDFGFKIYEIQPQELRNQII